MSIRVIALFSLAPNVSVDEYRQWSISHVRPVMRRMESVIRFDDYQIIGSMEGTSSEYELCEAIEITDIDQFERDNQTGEGADLAIEWRARLSRWSVMYLQDLAA